jgi:hypothetical protein
MPGNGTIARDVDYELGTDRPALQAQVRTLPAAALGPCHHADAASGACDCSWYRGTDEGGFDCLTCGHTYELHY